MDLSKAVFPRIGCPWLFDVRGSEQLYVKQVCKKTIHYIHSHKWLLILPTLIVKTIVLNFHIDIQSMKYIGG